MADDVSVSIVGAAELRRGVVLLAGDLERRVDDELLEVARRRADATVLIVPRVTGRLAGSVAVTRTKSGADVSIGDAGTPYAGWIEFGGTRGRPYIAEGRYLYPTALADQQQIERDVSRATTTEIEGFHWPRPANL